LLPLFNVLPLFNGLVLSTLGMSIYKLKVWVRKQQIKLLASFFKHNVPNNHLFFNMVKVVKEIFASKWDQIVGGFQKRKKNQFCLHYRCHWLYVYKIWWILQF
jgi:hypothetical protein